jgi:hypothetical protein
MLPSPGLCGKHIIRANYYPRIYHNRKLCSIHSLDKQLV